MAVCVAVVVPAAALGQTYPSKPIRNVLTVGVGGGADVLARMIGDKVFQSMGQPVVLDPQGAAGGAVGADMVARASPDGYTLLYGTSSTLVIRKFLARNTSYDVQRDFVPLMMLGETMSCVVAGPRLQVSTLAEAIEQARRNPGKLSYGSSGIGTTHHLAGEMVQMLTGTQMIHVPYKTGAQAAAEAVGGQLDLVYNILGPLQPFITSGKLRLLAVNSSRRYPQLPDVPAIAEILPGFQAPTSWSGYFAPAGLPEPIARRLSAELLKAASSADVVGKGLGFGFLIDPQGPAELAAAIRQSLDSTARIIKSAGIEPE
jgi:tripartite-type tricarboxylate transporter receptor subunit TctC